MILDFSYLDTLAECERRWYYRYVLGLEPKDEAVPLLMGTILHRALAVLYRTGWDTKAAEAELALAYAESGLRPIGLWSWASLGHLQTILKGYFKEWQGKERYKILETIEEPLVADIGVGELFGGIPDLLISEGSSVLVLDHKTTTGYLGSNLYNKVRFKHQMRIYQMLAAKVFDTKVDGAVVNAIYTGEKASVAGSKAARFDRFPLQYSQSQLEETREWIRRMRDRARVLEAVPEIGCIQNGGPACGWCDFNELCSSAPEVRPLKIGMHYQKKTFDGLLASGADS